MPRLRFQLLLLLTLSAGGCIIRREALEGMEEIPDAGETSDVGEGVDAFVRPADRDANVSPNTDAPFCGDGVRSPHEQCEDANLNNGDGCSETCVAEPGFDCASGVCVPRCGDGLVVGDERCDDNNGTPGDGCVMCMIESGFSCVGMPSLCAPTCGNRLIDAGEVCDDGNRTAGDGCDGTCMAEAGFTCLGVPSICARNCGNGRIESGEACDDAPPAESGDGCSATCTVESGFLCAGAPSVCRRDLCGNRMLDTGEGCDDGALGDGDGCSATCTRETGAICVGGGLIPQCSFAINYDAANIAIPDGSAVVLSFGGMLPATCRPNRVHYVAIDLQHEFLADVIVSVTNPAGMTVDLFRRTRLGMPESVRGVNLDGRYRFFSNMRNDPFPGSAVSDPVAPGDYNTVNGSGGRSLVLQTFMGASGMWNVRVEDAAAADVGFVRNVEIGVYCEVNP